ncbi:MAG: hypothetical protein EOP84_07770 [Verrucomicrobiaceae bacterium]|nr:MAG: hypothetical protein EOP84_07770 [Verrucomicrobiaceae bacterium]
MSLLASSQKSAGERLRRVTAEVTDLEPLSDGSLNLRLTGAEASTIRAAKVVLAVGNFPPGDPPLRDRHFRRSDRYLNDPWAKETHDCLAEPGDIVILGSGLTALDLLLSLEERKTEGRIHILSRRGLFPLPHRLGLPSWALSAVFTKENLPRKLRPMLRLVRGEVKRAEREGADWRAVIDALRPLTQPFWRNLPIPERRRFLRLLRAYWEPHRHRAPKEALAIRDRLVQSGQLHCHRGRIISIVETEQDLEVSIRRPGDSLSPPDTLRVRYVVNCTGPECNYQKLKDPLIVQLFGRGLIRPDPLLLGLDTDEDGGLINYLGASPRRVFTLGSPRKGMLLETTAVPELRVQARDLAKVLQGELVAGRQPLGLELIPERFYAFDI